MRRNRLILLIWLDTKPHYIGLANVRKIFSMEDDLDPVSNYPSTLQFQVHATNINL